MNADDLAWRRAAPTTRYDFQRPPSEDDRRRVCEWLEQHGIDVNDVAATGYIEVRYEARQIAYRGFFRKETPGVRPSIASAVVFVGDRVVQLESPPLAFPDGITCADVTTHD